jgi:hypothetical protein
MSKRPGIRVRRGPPALAAVVGAMLLAFVPGCAGDSRISDSLTEPRMVQRQTPQHHAEPRSKAVAASRCPAGLLSCRSAEGRIVYVERVDPDGDGDAHFVIFDPQGITLPDLTVIDVRKGLRPHPLPGPGDLISAAGPVRTGSYGQSQIHALELHVAGR